MTDAQSRIPSQLPADLPKPLPNLQWLWSHIAVNFITGLPISQGYNTIVVAVDWFSH